MASSTSCIAPPDLSLFIIMRADENGCFHSRFLFCFAMEAFGGVLKIFIPEHLKYQVNWTSVREVTFNKLCQRNNWRLRAKLFCVAQIWKKCVCSLSSFGAIFLLRYRQQFTCFLQLAGELKVVAKEQRETLLVWCICVGSLPSRVSI